MEKWLVELFYNGMPTGDIMKKAIDRTRELANKSEDLRHCNILILNLSKEQRGRTDLKLDGIRWQKDFKLKIFPVILKYGCWIFESGIVDHSNAEGGWVNWSMSGNFNRSGNGGYVTFYKQK
jgi:uncharacterized protein YciU (UPF0263 family)